MFGVQPLAELFGDFQFVEVGERRINNDDWVECGNLDDSPSVFALKALCFLRASAEPRGLCGSPRQKR